MDTVPPLSEDDRRQRAMRLIAMHIGRKARERRSARHLSQEDVGQLIGMSYQQVQKYESGDSHIGASRMVQLALALRADPREFLADLPDAAYEGLGFLPPRAMAMRGVLPAATGFAETQASLTPNRTPAEAAPVPLAELERLRDAFLRIPDEGKRRLLLDMAEALSVPV
jgi:transcriptional regulator with XRE-family HTH domain